MDIKPIALLLVNLHSPQGVLTTAVTQENIGHTICAPNYTAKILPPASYTNTLKAKQMKEYGLTGFMSDYEEDHFYPLSLGGHPTDPNNLWPQPWTGPNNAKSKNIIETALHHAVCNKIITLAQAQDCIKTWQTCVPPNIHLHPKTRYSR